MSTARYIIMPAAVLADEEITNTDLRVLAALGSYTDGKLEAFPKQEEIAKRARLVRETVNRSLKKLVKNRYVEIVEPEAGGMRRALKYRVLIDVIHQSQRCDPPVTTDVTPDDHNRCDHCTHTEDTHIKIPNKKPTKEISENLVGQFWDASPPEAKKRSSKRNLATAIRKLIEAGKDLEEILLAWKRYCADLKAKKKTEYAKGIHSWLNNQMFDAWVTGPEIDPLPPPEHDPLDQYFWEFARSGGKRWRGGNGAGYDYRPDDPRADYPTKYYARYGLMRPL